MRSFLLFVVLASVTCSIRAQQAPQYPLVTTLPLFQNTAPFGGLNQNGHQTQILYYASDFPGIPAGYIHRMYVKAGLDVPNSYSYSNFMISMGYKRDDIGVDTNCFKDLSKFYLSPVDTVLFSSNYTINAPVLIGEWVPFTFTKPFYYDGLSNLVVDIRPGYRSELIYFLHPFCFINPVSTCARWQIRDNSTDLYLGNEVIIIGFDITPSTVNSLERQIDVELYPNPAQGNVNININTRNTKRDLAVTIVNTTGTILLQKRYQNIVGGFSEQIDMTGVAQGLYFVEIKADNEKLVRKLNIR